MLVVAKREKANRAYFSNDHDLDRDPGLRGSHGNHLNRLHQRNLCTMGRLQQLGRINIFRRLISATAGTGAIHASSTHYLARYLATHYCHSLSNSTAVSFCLKVKGQL